ncbi:hypothetical protein K438DRAFT_1782540 [Mycena galopus ATCC 62051]|nr:hypothetical protein K438DRAFT_1782540 [Mycena galopus ATCC 62051]
MRATRCGPCGFCITTLFSVIARALAAACNVSTRGQEKERSTGNCPCTTKELEDRKAIMEEADESSVTLIAPYPECTSTWHTPPYQSIHLARVDKKIIPTDIVVGHLRRSLACMRFSLKKYGILEEDQDVETDIESEFPDGGKDQPLASHVSPREIEFKLGSGFRGLREQFP